MSPLNTAIKIFKILLEKGQLDRNVDSDLFLDFRQPEVRSVLAELEEEMEFAIVESAGTLYLVPASGNDLLGFVTKDLREWVASDARLADAFLLCYIIMFLVYLFYGGKNINPKQREFLRVSALLEELDRRFGLALREREATEALEEKYALNFLKVAEVWDSKRGFEERSRKTKVGTVLSVCRLLERERLIRLVDEDREIRTTKKLDDLMLHHYLQENRVQEINRLFEGGGEEDAKDQ
ncbi:MAG TPA: hypothetical protein GX711_04950 [Clostridia bacterium]|nr:hypothetical protein [Clostridia bacterium]